jgi:hypothetical protein
MACCDFSGSVCLGKHVESIVKVLTLVDFVTSNDGSHINDGQMRGHSFTGSVCVCVCVCVCVFVCL